MTAKRSKPAPASRPRLDPLVGTIPERKVLGSSPPSRRGGGRRRGGLFLRGPIPFDWIARAYPDPADRLPLVLRAFMEIEGKDDLRVSMGICRHAGIRDRHQRRRCLKRLEETRLFEVSSRQGRSPVVRKLW